MSRPMRLSLVADIGGTNTRVALARGPHVLPDTIRRFANAAHADLAAVIAAYRTEHAAACAGACVAMAGPVRDGRGLLTNLDWVVDGAHVAEATGADTVAVLNDLQAQGHALGHLDGIALRPVLPGAKARRDAARLMIGVGTGFNAAPVYAEGPVRLVPPAEAGHTDLPVSDPGDLRLAAHLAARHGFASVEEVLSGRGLGAVYAFHAFEAGAPGHKSSAAVLEGLATGDEIATTAMRTFVRMLGRVAGNLALNTLPFGGIFLVGGMSRAVAPHLETHGFAEAFRDKGRFADFMDGFPVWIVEDDYAALTGCAAHIAAQMAAAD